MFFFLRGLLIGFSIAAPVGPIGVLTIRRTLTEGWTIGLLTGLGAATADAIYGCVAGFGLTFISNLLVEQAFLLRVAGGLFLAYLGIKTFLAKPIDREAATQGKGWLAAYGSTVFLTLTNPMTILAFAAVFAGLGLATSSHRGSHNAFEAVVLVTGVFVGSALWWITLCSGVRLFRAALTPYHLRWLNRISGLILLTFGIIALNPM